jgi:hypothetical protein
MRNIDCIARNFVSFILTKWRARSQTAHAMNLYTDAIFSAHKDLVRIFHNRISVHIRTMTLIPKIEIEEIWTWTSLVAVFCSL